MLRILATTVLISATPALATEIERKLEIDAPAEEVWQKVGGFCSIESWHPAVTSCAEESIDGIIHRRLVTADGAEFLEMHKPGKSGTDYGYEIIESPLPVKGYVSSFSVVPNGDTSTVVWSSKFEADGVSEEEAGEIVGGIYETGLEAIRSGMSE